jgi:hypothetical protein
MKNRNVLLIAFLLRLIHPASYSQSPCAGQPLDVLFVVDATSSMREELAALPQNLQYFKTQWTDADLRTGGLVFRDQMERFIYKDYPLNPGVDSTWHFLTTFPAVGGGDDAEPLNDMLAQARKFDWREGANRLVIFLSDAPPREPERTQEACLQLLENQIRVVVLSPDGAGDAALTWQQQVGKSTNGLLLDWEDPYWHEEVLSMNCPNATQAINRENTPASFIKIYPNPASKNATIEAMGSIRIWDNQGRLLFEGENKEGPSLPLDLTGWAPGLYWVQAENGEVGKLVVME